MCCNNVGPTGASSEHVESVTVRVESGMPDITRVVDDSSSRAQARQRELFRKFRRFVAKGVSCTYLGRHGECRFPARLHVDKAMLHFWVVSADAAEAEKILHPTVAFGAVRVVERLQKETMNLVLDSEAVAVPRLAEGEVERTALVMHILQRDDFQDHFPAIGQLLILLEDTDLAGFFVESIKALSTHKRDAEGATKMRD